MSLRLHIEAHRQYPNPEPSATLFSDRSKPIMVVSTSERYKFGVRTLRQRLVSKLLYKVVILQHDFPWWSPSYVVAELPVVISLAARLQ